MDQGLSPQAYEELIGQSVDMLTVLDESGSIRYVSPSVRRLAGYDPDELVGENAFDYVHPDDRQKTLDTFYEVVESVENHTTGSVDFRFRHEDGSWIWLEGRGSNQVATTVEGYVISSRDIADRKEYEQELQRERDRRERFASFVSHDLRNPLNVAAGRLELAREECESDHLDAVARSLERMDELIDDVMALVRESEAEPLLDAVSLARAAEECWEHVDTREATLAVETDPSILADEAKLQHLLENLVRNAVEHGGEDVTITIGRLDDGFFVEDDGRGIPEENHEAVLEYGFSSKADGTGLGLSIASEVVESHGWDLTVTAGRDGGARFEITGVDVVE